MLALYGHQFSSYTWKALIPLYANATPFEFRPLDPSQPSDAHGEFVDAASPLGRFPVLVDGPRTVFEATAIIEYLHLHHPGPAPLLPADLDAAVEMRMMDRVFDLSVMTPTQEIVNEYIRAPDNPDAAVVAREEQRLVRAYRWIDGWLDRSPRQGDDITMIECAAAPSLFYADWVYPIPQEFARLRDWRAHLMALPAVKRCVDDARPYRHFFPLGAPDRD